MKKRATVIFGFALSITFSIGCGADDANTPGSSEPAEPGQAAHAEEEGQVAEAEPERPRTREHHNPEEAALGTLPEGVGIAVGETAPDVTVHDIEGEERTLASLWAEGSVLLVFYRGGWCPFCNFQVHALAEAFPRFSERGITPAMISVDRPEEGARTSASWEVPFPVLSDPDLVAHRAFRVLNELDEAGVERLRGFGMDIEEYSGREHHTIAIPAVFLIDAQGVVRWAHAAHDYRTRPSPEQILAATAAL